MRVTGKLTYASQQPWVFSGTIRSNILFGRELDPEKYERVLKACALKRVRDCCSQKKVPKKGKVKFGQTKTKSEEKKYYYYY